jgi:hypothetical protein
MKLKIENRCVESGAIGAGSAVGVNLGGRCRGQATGGQSPLFAFIRLSSPFCGGRVDFGLAARRRQNSQPDGCATWLGRIDSGARGGSVNFQFTMTNDQAQTANGVRNLSNVARRTPSRGLVRLRTPFHGGRRSRTRIRRRVGRFRRRTLYFRRRASRDGGRDGGQGVGKPARIQGYGGWLQGYARLYKAIQAYTRLFEIFLKCEGESYSEQSGMAFDFISYLRIGCCVFYGENCSHSWRKLFTASVVGPRVGKMGQNGKGGGWRHLKMRYRSVGRSGGVEAWKSIVRSWQGGRAAAETAARPMNSCAARAVIYRSYLV